MAERKTPPSRPRTPKCAANAASPPRISQRPGCGHSRSARAAGSQGGWRWRRCRAGEPTKTRFHEQLSRITAPPELDDPQNRKRWKLEELDHKRGPYLFAELNVQDLSGLPGAAKDFLALFDEVCAGLAGR